VASIVYNFEIVATVIVHFDEGINLLADFRITIRVRGPRFLDIVMVDFFKHLAKFAYLPFYR
jgi:hypothetical protein